MRRPQPQDARWGLRVDTTNAKFEKEERVYAPGDTYALQGRALALFEALASALVLCVCFVAALAFFVLLFSALYYFPQLRNAP